MTKKTQSTPLKGASMQHHNAAVLGASGLVAQRMQQRLAHHPWFRLTAVVGSKRTAGRALSSIEWNLSEERPELPDLTVLDAQQSDLLAHLQSLDISVVFSCLPASVADPLELILSSTDIAVFSNASAFRRAAGIPLVIPDVNPSHMELFRSANHALACATNCTLIPLAVPTAALNHAFGVRSVRMNSEQALSGAGYELVLSQDALQGKHSSEIDGEAEKTAAELLHVLGDLIQAEQHQPSKTPSSHSKMSTPHTHVRAADVAVEVACQRVTRIDGHQIFAQITLKQPTTLDAVMACFLNQSFDEHIKACPSAPLQSIHLVDSIDTGDHLWSDGVSFERNPDPSVNLRAGMAVVVGSVKMINPTTVGFSAYSHNTIRGAAGGTMLLAEQAYIEQRLPKQQQA
jgi:aspartate-semialdehyde dehydrogenase